MAAPACPVLTQRFRAFSKAVGLVVAGAAGLTLAVWPWHPGLAGSLFRVPNPLSALSLMAAGLALALAQRGTRTSGRAVKALALVPIVYGSAYSLLSLCQRLTLVTVPLLPAPQPTLSLLLLGLALVLLDARPLSRRYPASMLSLLALVFPYLALVGYAFHLGLDAPLQPHRSMSVPMAVALSLLAVATLASRPDRGGMALLTGGTAGGTLLRRLAPGALWAPIVLGWLGLLGERAGLFGPEMGAALMTLTMSVVGLALILWNVHVLNVAEAERESAETALKESEARYRLVADYSSDLLTLHSPEGITLYASPASQKLLGHSPQELLGTSPRSLILAEDHPNLAETRRLLLAGVSPLSLQYRVRRKDGAVRWLESTIQDIPDDAPGAIKAMLVVSRDITDRIAAETALKESEARYRRLIEVSPEAILVDQEGRLIFVNPAGAALLAARDPAELIGRSLLDFVHPDFVQTFCEQMARARGGERGPIVFEKQMVRLDDGMVEVETTISPITYGGKEATIAIMRDITERKKAMEEIAMRTAELKKATELDRLKDHFLSTLSHEMKTPLSLIVGYAELLEDKYPDEDLLKGVQDGARRLKEHIDSMLDYSALLSGTLPLYKTEVYLGEIVETASHITAAGREQQRQQLEVRLDPRIPPISADPRRMTQIMVELLDNASKFSPVGGRIGLSIGTYDGMVALEVWDTGPGIPPEARELIFEPFAQLAIGNTGRRGGLGLGLTIVRKLTELHGGSIEVSSEPGMGSRFIVRLPILDA